MNNKSTPLLKLREVSKTYPGVHALNDVRLEVLPGEIHALVGENGAGKSTLINVISGAVQPDAGGTYLFDGAPVTGLTPAKARTLGIAVVFQEFALAPDLSVVENMFLGQELTRGGLLRAQEMRDAATKALRSAGFSLPLDSLISTLSRAEQQMVEIAKAMLHDVKLLILDEPTASLTESDTERLFILLQRMRDAGVAIIYVSHRMPELLRLADRITVLRDGTYIDCVKAEGVTQQSLVELMSGRPAGVLFPAIATTPGEVALELRDVCLDDVKNASFSVRRGEIVGIAGLVGCGKSELIRAVFGIEKVHSGSIKLHGSELTVITPERMLSQGVAYFPADRNSEGLALNRPIRENVTFSSIDQLRFSLMGFIKRKEETRATLDITRLLALRPHDVQRPVGTLSGGNRQKVMLARGLARPTSLFLFDEPTVGIDVGAKLEAYEFIRQLVAQGAAVVVVSSELPEVLGLAHRVYVMSQGAIVAEHQGPNIQEKDVLNDFFYHYPAGGHSTAHSEAAQ